MVWASSTRKLIIQVHYLSLSISMDQMIVGHLATCTPFIANAAWYQQLALLVVKMISPVFVPTPFPTLDPTPFPTLDPTPPPTPIPMAFPKAEGTLDRYEI